jgi:hypothetical protein
LEFFEGGAMSNVVVIFQAETEETEQLALAVAVGAVEAEASIRLRRLMGADSIEVAHKGYGQLKEADLEWAETVVVGLEEPAVGEALEGLLSLLDVGGLQGKRGWTFGRDGIAADGSEARGMVEAAMLKAGIELLSAEALGVGTRGDRIEQMKVAGRASGRVS